MPINSCSENGNPGYKWGEKGKCYTYTKNNKKSMQEAKNKANLQGVAARINGYEEKSNDAAKTLDTKDQLKKNLNTWFRERWVDISRPKPGGGYHQCGRSDASSGKYPKCVPAARAARMSPAQIASAVRRKRRAESTQSRQDKKPINVSTDIEKASRNVPTNPSLYARVKAEAKRKFDVYPSAYANAWLVREYKKRGGGYRTVAKSEDVTNKVADDLDQQEAILADLLIELTEKYGKFNEDGIGVWAGYDSPEENDVADIGVKCKNCILYAGNGVCKIIEKKVEDEGKCRFAIIPDGVVETDKEIYDMLRTVSMDTRSFMKDNMKKMINDHLTMKSWHEVSAKAAAEQMQDHIKAAAWHDSQINVIKGMITEVPLDPEKKALSIPAGGASSVPASRKEKENARQVPLDPKTLRKNDLVDMLINHEEQYGKFDIPVEDVANFLFEQ